jgi:ribosomal protein S18 acetylase RimI-like enzyme
VTVATAELSLRPTTPGDDAFLRRVYAGVREEELSVVAWTDEQRDTFLAQQFEAQDAYYREHYQPATFDVIELESDPVGRLYVVRWEDEIRIVDISLLPEHRGRGIGTALIRALLDEAAAAGKRLSIHVEVHNRARRLYERLGFLAVAENGIYLLMEVTP